MLRLSVVAAAVRVGLVVVVLAVSCSTALWAGGAAVSDVPRLDGITVDGDPADWGERGFRIELLTSAGLDMLPADDLEAECRLGWNGDGLLVLVSALDDVPYESRRGDALWEADSIELFVAPGDDCDGEKIWERRMTRSPSHGGSSCARPRWAPPSALAPRRDWDRVCAGRRPSVR